MPNGPRDYFGSCWRRRVTRVVMGPVYLRWENGQWNRQPNQWHWHRAEFVFKLWPCRHEVTFRLRRGEFPTMAMGRAPYATAAWPGRELPCTVCGPAPTKEKSFDHRPVGWSYQRIGKRKYRRVKVPAALPDLPPQVAAYEAEIAARGQYQHLAALYDS